MKTKPPKPIRTRFPTCGEAFYFLVNALDLTAWADATHAADRKRRGSSEIRALSDQLRDWATEKDGHAPSREELERFIRDQVRTLPRAEEIAFALCSLWRRVLDEHADLARENATYLDREDTRAWYARTCAPGALYFLWALQKLLRRISPSGGPMLDVPLNVLLVSAWPEDTTSASAPRHPLHQACYRHYASLRAEGSASVDARTFVAWDAGEDRPSFEALGRHFSQLPDMLGLLLNFAFTNLLEALASMLRSLIPQEDWSDCRRMLVGQARCVHELDGNVADDLARSPAMGVNDYERLLASHLGEYMMFLAALSQSGPNSLDLRVVRFRVYEEYQHRFAESPPPPRFRGFCDRLNTLWTATALHAPRLTPSEVESALAGLRAEHPDWSDALAGPLFAIEARLSLCHDPPTVESLQTAFTRYQRAFAECRYRAGTYTASVAREALGLGALLHRRESGVGAIKPWMKMVLAWWDLLGLGTEFDHEQPEQRIELAESWLTDRLERNLRDRLRAALPQLGLNHWRVAGTCGFVEPGMHEALQATAIDRRQKMPMSTTMVGRDQTALMEAIDRGQLDTARELVRKGANLNFINSAGDTCVTKAFARRAYELVLEILRRDKDPIRRETLLRVTSKMKSSSLEKAISEGHVEILRELALERAGRGAIIDLSMERIQEQTPLYYAVNCLALLRMSSEEAIAMAQRLGNLPSALTADELESFKWAHGVSAQQHNPSGVLECINYLVNDLHVALDAPNANGHSALTYAAEHRLHDVAVMLVAAGANVNHRFHGGGTALVYAILNEDCETAKLLVEHGADHRLFVESLGQPICMMQMSERMQRLVPNRL